MSKAIAFCPSHSSTVCLTTKDHDLSRRLSSESDSSTLSYATTLSGSSDTVKFSFVSTQEFCSTYSACSDLSLSPTASPAASPTFFSSRVFTFTPPSSPLSSPPSSPLSRPSSSTTGELSSHNLLFDFHDSIPSVSSDSELLSVPKSLKISFAPSLFFTQILPNVSIAIPSFEKMAKRNHYCIVIYTLPALTSLDRPVSPPTSPSTVPTASPLTNGNILVRHNDSYSSFFLFRRRLLQASKKPCHTSSSPCPLASLYGLLKDVPFPAKRYSLFKLNKKQLEERRKGLETFLQTVLKYVQLRLSNHNFMQCYHENCVLFFTIVRFIGLQQLIDHSDRTVRRKQLRNPTTETKNNECTLSQTKEKDQKSKCMSVIKPLSLSSWRNHLMKQNITTDLLSSVSLSSPSSSSSSSSSPSSSLRSSYPISSNLSYTQNKTVLSQIRDELLSTYGHYLPAINDKLASTDHLNNRWDCAFLLACRIGNLYAIQSFVQEGASLDATLPKGQTGLHLACEYGYYEIASYLITMGGSINSSTNKGITPLILACHYGYERIVRLLLNVGVNLNIRTHRGVSPLHAAVTSGFAHIVELLVKQNAKVNCRTKMGLTPLHFAVQNNSVEICRILVQYEANTKAEGYQGMTPLILAYKKMNETIIDILTNEKGRTQGEEEDEEDEEDEENRWI